MHKQMFITVEGGLIQSIDVTADLRDIHVTLIDLDTEGSDHDEVSVLPNWDEAFVQEYALSEIGDGDVETWEEILELEK